LTLWAFDNTALDFFFFFFFFCYDMQSSFPIKVMTKLQKEELDEKQDWAFLSKL